MAFNAAYKPRRTFPALVLAALLATMISTLFAGSKCRSLPTDASEEKIKAETLKLLAEHAPDQVTIGGHALLQNDHLREKIVRRSARYTSGNEVRISRSNTEVQVCVEQTQPSGKKL